MAKVATDKIWLHQPLFRPEQAFNALDLPFNRASISRWFGEVATLVSPIVWRMTQMILKSKVIQSDATIMSVFKKYSAKHT